MDPVFPLAMLAAIAGAAALAWRSARPRSRAHGLRTSWSVLCYRCTHRLRRGADVSGCPECGSGRLMPLSGYQASGGGTGLKYDPDGPLVASLCEGEWKPSESDLRLPQGTWHAPLFDLDYPAAAMASGGATRLVLHRPVSRPALASLRLLMAEIGLARLPPESDEASGPPGIESYRAQAYMPETTFDLVVPARLVPSSTTGHFHLYLDVRVRWEDYVRLLEEMRDAGLVDGGWFDLALRRKMAVLRKPHVRKGAEAVPLAAS